MAKRIVFDAVYITLHIPSELPEQEREILRRTLGSEVFMGRLRRAVRRVVRVCSELAVVRVTLSR